MRIGGNSTFDNKVSRRWSYRYTMVTVICVLLVAAAAIVTFDNSPRWMAEDDGNINLTDQPDDNTIGEGGINVIQPVPTVDSNENTAEKPAEEDISGSGPVFPVEGGRVILDYSGNGLVYSKTLDQYVIHEGVDISAPIDTPVMAVSDGEVSRIYNDDKLGITIVLTHEDGYVTRYSSLSTDRMVKEGDAVKAGQVISSVGITALFESLDSPHLHLEVWRNGEIIDPSKYISLD